MSAHPARRVVFAFLSILAAPLGAQVESRPFPLLAQGDGVLRPLPESLAELATLKAVRLVDVPLPDGAFATLEVQRVPIASQDAALFVDGERLPGSLDAGVSLWSGQVAGDGDSDVFLAFSLRGSRGWVRSGGELLHLLARPGDDGSWSATRSQWAGESGLRAAGAVPPPLCVAQQLPALGPGALPRMASAASAAEGSLLPLLECRLVVETDFEYFQIFGDLEAASTYALSLLGAVSDRYREQVGVILTLPYLGLYTTSADPWFWSSNGGNSIDVLYEFQDAWAPGFGGSPPAAGDISHFLSGADLGGGVAWLPGLCDPDYGFAVSGNLGGVTPFPIAVGPLNWDFVVVAHEIGHNLNAPHTHSYCPPLDQCAPAGWFGPCQSTQVCTTEGTIMSYCHLCDGGFLNETTYFHAQSAADMRAMAEGGCLQPFEGVIAQDLGYAKPGLGGTPTLSVGYDKTAGSVHIDAAQLPPSKPGVLFLSPSLLLAPFKGGVLVPGADFLLALVSPPSGPLGIAAPVTTSFPTGIELYAQEWFKDSGPGYAATNGVHFELIVP